MQIKQKEYKTKKKRLYNDDYLDLTVKKGGLKGIEF